MNPDLLPLLHLQGDLKVALLQYGLSQERAHDLAGKLLDLIAKSLAIKPNVAAAYEALSEGDVAP